MLERIVKGELDHRGGEEMDVLFEVNGKPYRMYLDVISIVMEALSNDVNFGCSNLLDEIETIVMDERKDYELNCANGVYEND